MTTIEAPAGGAAAVCGFGQLSRADVRSASMTSSRLPSADAAWLHIDSPANPMPFQLRP